MAKLMLGTKEVTPAIFTGGTTPAGTLSITQNGTYDVTNYVSANVNVSGSSGYTELPTYKVDASGVASKRDIRLTGTEFSNIIQIDLYGMSHAFYLGGLEGALNFPVLTRIDICGMEYAFYGCDMIEVHFPALTSIGSWGMRYAFAECSEQLDIYFPALTTTSFNGGSRQFEGMIDNTDEATLHFPSNLESTISTLTGYPTFGGNDPTCVFDLPATS